MQQSQISNAAVIEHIEFILDSSINRSKEILKKLGVNVEENENVSGGEEDVQDRL